MLSNITSNASAFAAAKYDFVIIGGGTAGLAVASRLSENPNISVGVLEAGQDLSEDPNVKPAGGWLATTFGPEYSWGIETTPQISAAGQKMSLPRGKLIGGCSAMNAMMWTRASKPEYDAIAALGNPGWTFDDLVPYFKKIQSHTPQENAIIPGFGKLNPAYQGTSGPIKTSFNTWYSSLIRPYVESALELSYNINSDADSGDITGISNIPRTVDGETAARQHSGVTYLALAAGRSNISVLVGAHATKIIFAKGSGDLIATGVQFEVDGVTHTVNANKEVILSAGTYHTPQLLELSGIGKKSVLSQYGIETLLELPGVGENLQDHLMINMNYGLTPEAQADLKVVPISADIKAEPGTDAKSTSTGGPFLFSNLDKICTPKEKAELLAILDSYLASDSLTPLERVQFETQRVWYLSPNVKAVDVQIMFGNLPGAPGLPLPDGTMMMWMPSAHLHPTSRGCVHIVSSDPHIAPAIDHKFLSRDYDLRALLHVTRFTQRLTKAGPFAAILSGSLVPPPNLQTDEEMIGFIKGNIATVFHPEGTAAMASRDLGGVVDYKLKVYGTRNLRIVDASVIPTQLGCTPMATIYVIAEKAAEFIKSEL